MQVVETLLNKGVRIPNPGSVEIGPEVDIERIAGEGVTIHAGCRISGENTLILPGVRLGQEGPVTIENCLIGPSVKLKGGFFREAVFLEKASCGLGAQVREGTILEEEASIAHTVGLKQTILFPFVTLGSLINFCDCLMAGGTDRKNHSEVGSSYIHFNFTPNQDKATPSMIGDVPRGVMLNQRPIFLGGQGGMVGPVRLTYGITVAAGAILRKDELQPDRLIIGGAGKAGSVEYRPGGFSGATRIIRNNLIYTANLMALRHWYREVRSLFVGKKFPELLLTGLLSNIHKAIDERAKRLKELGDKMAASGDSSLFERWPVVEQVLAAQSKHQGNDRLRESFLEKTFKAIESEGRGYIAVIRGLPGEASEQGTAWLQGIVDDFVEAALAALK
jgi:bifunctional UDP-N-acetylglucosamine pyrophosphorylase / glucosamine-1-phosphate N-acetyltransferase